jgi:hypothetical protein
LSLLIYIIVKGGYNIMARLGKDEFNKKYSEKINDDDLLIELMEDATDSFDNESEVNSLKEKLEQKEKEYEDLKAKYKERFLSSDELPKKEVIEDIQEKEYVDIREI